MNRSRVEQETIIRWDAAGPDVLLATFHPATVAKWRKRGYPVTQAGSEWRAKVPKRCISFRSYVSKPSRRSGFVSQSHPGLA